MKQTEVTQPAVYTMDMAAYAALREALGASDNAGSESNAKKSGTGSFAEPLGVAGFSLGEYAAYTAAGVISSFEEGLDLVKIRALLMKEAGTDAGGNQRGTMAAGIGKREAVLELIQKARADDVLEAVNFNSPTQTVVAGDVIAVERFSALAAEDRGFGVKAIKLTVSGAFHSSLMKPAAERLAEALKDFDFKDPSLPVYLNVTGGPYEDYEKIAIGSANAKVKAIMVCQMQSPVYWQQTIEAMASAGIETIIEVGPGKTLTGLVKKINPELVALHVEDAESMNETVDYMKGG